MGRALFSEKYGYNAAKAPAIRVAGESNGIASAISPDPARWSVSNPFDPDSDEFFAGAEYEAFMDMGEVDRLEHPVVSSDSGSESSDSGRDSPLEDPPRPVVLSAMWDRRVDESESATESGDGIVTIRTTAESDRPRPVVVSVLHPRRVSVPPISIPVEPSTPSTPSPTTPPAVYNTHVQLITPSPPPTVTPRIYVWGGPSRTSPASPSVRHTYSHSAGPLTNPGARQSLARITPRRRAQNV